MYPTAQVEKWHAKSFTLETHLPTSSATSLPHPNPVEDRRCDLGHEEHDLDVCEGCELPICSKCKSSLSKGELPALALANDMFTGYVPRSLVEQNVTVMEAICASPCVTTLVCMTMEARYENNAKQEAQMAEPLNANAHMARHRFGARGNALTFPLPLEDLFLALQGNQQDLDEGRPLQLPRVGTELAHVARVLLKTNKEGATSEKDIKTLIHQAIVRREAGHCTFHFKLSHNTIPACDIFDSMTSPTCISVPRQYRAPS